MSCSFHNVCLVGAHQDGVEGFFRGVGRGIMGLITKPALGVIDSVAMACDAVRRAVDLGHEVSAPQWYYNMQLYADDLLSNVYFCI